MLERSAYYTEDHARFAETVRRFVADEIMPYHAQWEEDGVVPRAIYTRAGELGLLAPCIPEAFGGSGADWLYSAIVLAEMGIAGASGPGFPAHSEMVMPYILDYGEQPLKERLLPAMSSGELIGAIAMTEPDGGSDLRAMRTRAIRDGDHYVINGQKTYISNGQIADVIVLACKTQPELGGRGISLIVVEADMPGFKRGKRLKKLGLKAQDTSELFFEDVRVPVGNRLGEEGAGFAIMMSKLAQERLSIAVKSVSIARAILNETIGYTRERKAFGQTIADFQNTRFVVAGLDAEIAAAEALVIQGIGDFMEKRFTPTDAARAKLLTTELMCKTIDNCLQFFGGNGYMLEYRVARAYIDARISRIAGGASEVMKQIIARELFEN
jgi:alkylation response protein AidB-like acyl-CoA dehydrogenase